VSELLEIKARMRSIQDFPAEGILFRDITPILADPALFQQAVDALTDYARRRGAQAIVGIESRGFLMGAPVALALKVPFVPIRKAGKLPAETVSMEYALEYGSATIEMHKDALAEGQRVVLIDDLLATGGTAEAACHLVEEVGGSIAGIAFLVELVELEGRDRLTGYEVASFVRY
jgi:adenine phosphoribosyltransferase